MRDSNGVRRLSSSKMVSKRNMDDTEKSEVAVVRDSETVWKAFNEPAEP